MDKTEKMYKLYKEFAWLDKIFNGMSFDAWKILRSLRRLFMAYNKACDNLRNVPNFDYKVIPYIQIKMNDKIHLLNMELRACNSKSDYKFIIKYSEDLGDMGYNLIVKKNGDGYFQFKEIFR